MIKNLQFLRFLAAASVVFYHVNYTPFGLHSEFGAVVVFFCISGFVMTLVTRDDGKTDFLLRRIIRIVPLYWLLTLAYYLLIILPQGRAAIVNAPQDFDELLLSLLFLPYRNAAGIMEPVLNVGWTLNLEFFFYVLFAACLKISRRFAPALSALVVILVWVSARLADLPDWAEFYGRDHVLYFAMGIGVYYIWRGMKGLSASVIVMCFVAALLYPLLVVVAPWPSALVLPPAFLLAVLTLERGKFIVRSRLMLLLGNASYSIYLSHFLVLLGWRVAMNWWPLPHFEYDAASAVTAFALCIALGLAIHVSIEAPMTRALRGLRLTRATLSAPRQA